MAATKKKSGNTKLSDIDRAELELNERMAKDMLAQGIGKPQKPKSGKK